MANGKAQLIMDDYCDGLGNCLPVCPADAISFEQREAMPYNEELVQKNKQRANIKTEAGKTGLVQNLGTWPIQIKLVSPNARFFDNCDLLIAADCCAYAYSNFYNEFICRDNALNKQAATVIGCPKLDNEDYSIKLGAIISENNIKSITITRMEVPCCGGIEYALKTALKKTGKQITGKIITLSVDGHILGEETL
jgi:ferredoxin